MFWISTAASLGSASITRSLVLFFSKHTSNQHRRAIKDIMQVKELKKDSIYLGAPLFLSRAPLQIFPTFKRNWKLNSWGGEVNACPGLGGAPSSPLLLNPYLHTLCLHSMFLTKFVINLTPSLGGSGGSPRNRRASSLLGELRTNFVFQSEWAALGLRKPRI